MFRPKMAFTPDRDVKKFFDQHWKMTESVFFLLFVLPGLVRFDLREKQADRVRAILIKTRQECTCEGKSLV